MKCSPEARGYILCRGASLPQLRRDVGLAYLPPEGTLEMGVGSPLLYFPSRTVVLLWGYPHNRELVENTDVGPDPEI